MNKKCKYCKKELKDRYVTDMQTGEVMCEDCFPEDIPEHGDKD